MQTSPICRWAPLVVFIFLAFVYAYFFQGGGWNQNAQFDTVRAIAERGTLEITPYAANTGDAVAHGDKVFSNKPPGLALLGSPVYAALQRAERALGLDPMNVYIVNTNAHVVTFWAAGLPAALLGLALYYYFRRQSVSVASSTLLAGAFGLGTLILPYSGVLFTHSLVAMCLFTAFLLITGKEPGRGTIAAAGALLGYAMVTKYLASPVAGFCLVYLIWRFRRDLRWLHLLWGPAAAAGVILTCNYWAYGSPWMTIYSVYPESFTADGLFMGVLDWPDIRRLYWLSIHPYRGLLYCCPVLFLSLAGLVIAFRQRRIDPAGRLALAVCAYYLLFNLTFNGWTGGWGIGPRYLIPALPFLYTFTHHALRRLKWTALPVMGLSVFLMVGVTAVCVMIPAENFGPPIDINPTARALDVLFEGRVSISRQSVLDRNPATALPGGLDDWWDAYNLGEVWGLEGPVSLLPVAAAVVLFCGVCALAARRCRTT